MNDSKPAPHPLRVANPIPPADPNVGFVTRVNRAIDELVAAVTQSTLNDEQRQRLFVIMGRRDA